MYSFFIVAEIFADIFVSWFPFYYELKIVFILFLTLGKVPYRVCTVAQHLHPATLFSGARQGTVGTRSTCL